MFLSFILEFMRPSFLLFVGLLIVSINLIIRHKRLSQTETGFRGVVFGTTLITFGSFLDFFEEIAFKAFFDNFAVFGLDIDDFILVFIYFPACLIIFNSLSKWLPDIRRLTREVQRREKVEEELKNTLISIEAMAKKAKTANEAKSAFLANMSHELRTPLNAIIGFSEMLAEDDMALFEPDQQLEYLAIINSSGKHLLSIINDILDLSKVDAGKMAIKVTQSGSDELIKSATDYQKIPIAEKDIEFSLDLCKAEIITDKRILHQIMVNLISNAVKFTPISGKIHIQSSFANRMLAIEIKDTGIGMTPEELKNVMEPFVQVNNQYSTKTHGTGLGLALVIKFVELLHGELIMNSVKGEGTEIKLLIPSLDMEKQSTDEENMI